MPAPAVIPAPKAYINAVAVKGFVVELRVAQDAGSSSGAPALATREHSKQVTRERFPSDSRVQRTQEGARDLYCD